MWPMWYLGRGRNPVKGYAREVLPGVSHSGVERHAPRIFVKHARLATPRCLHNLWGCGNTRLVRSPIHCGFSREALSEAPAPRKPVRECYYDWDQRGLDSS